MRKKFKKLVSLLLIAGMIFSFMPINASKTVKAEETDLIARYPLVSDIKDVSGNGNDAIILKEADGVTFTGGALTLAEEPAPVRIMCRCRRDYLIIRMN